MDFTARHIRYIGGCLGWSSSLDLGPCCGYSCSCDSAGEGEATALARADVYWLNPVIDRGAGGRAVGRHAVGRHAVGGRAEGALNRKVRLLDVRN